MSKAAKEAVATIAALPEKERKQALAVARAVGKVYEQIKNGKVINLNECSPYKGCRSYQGKEVVDQALESIGAEINGGKGGQGNKLTATLGKFQSKKATICR